MKRSKPTSGQPAPTDAPASRRDDRAPFALGLRCYPVLVKQKKRRKRFKRSLAPPDYAFVLDTEVVPGAEQELTFGSYRFLARNPDGEPFTYNSIEEVLFHADDAPADAIERLQAYGRTHEAETTALGSRPLRVLPLSEVVEELFIAAVRVRALIVGFNLPFDLSRLAFDAKEAKKGARGGFSFILSTYRDANGVICENRYRPRITIKSIDSKRCLKSLTHPSNPDPPDRTPDDRRKPVKGFYPPGNFLDLRTLAFALTDRGHTLDSACEAFGVERKGDPGTHPGWDFTPEYIDYNRRDVRITGELMAATLLEYARHPVGVHAVEVFSPATIGRGYLNAMNIKAPLKRWPRFPKPELGITMSTFYGGRTSARIRRFLVPIRYYDFTSMYPTCNALLRTWDLLTAADYQVDDVTDRARALLASLTLDGLFDPATWPELSFFAKLIPNGDILPVRTKWNAGDARQIGINPLTTEDAIWYAGPDLAASVLLSGKVPQIEEAFAIVPKRGKSGRILRNRGMRPVKLLDAIPIDPRRENFFTRVIEARQLAKKDKDLSDAERDRRDLGLKVIANASSYGILAQRDPSDLPGRETAAVEVYGALGTFATATAKPERPGPYFFPPIAALITSAARCILAMLERCVTGAGGTYAMEDTDSMAIVATRDGGLVPCPGGPHAWTSADAARYDGPNPRTASEAVQALSFDDVDEIAGRFESLNPYAREAVEGSILKTEGINFDDGSARQLYCYAISSKRYALYTCDEHGEPRVARNGKGEAHCSEHGLGHLLNPTNIDSDDRQWIVQSWETIAREHLGLPTEKPSWLVRPALTQLSISTLYLRRPFELDDDRLPYRERIKPFNFLLAAHIAAGGFPLGADTSRFLLVAPYQRDPQRWSKVRWRDVHSKNVYRATTDRQRRVYDPSLALIATYETALRDFRLHPEAKSLCDGLPVDEDYRNSTGVLTRRPAFVPRGLIENIGKESNELQQTPGLVQDEDEVVQVYRDRGDVPFERYRVLLRAIPKRDLTSLSKLSPGTIKMARHGRTLPQPANQGRLLRAIVVYFSNHPLPTFETIEQLDPTGIAAEIRADAAVDTGRACPSEAALASARLRTIARYERSIATALALLAL
jgi:hypothetical protein